MTDATTAAEALVTAYCGWHIAPSINAVLTLDGPDGHALLLPSLHVTEITSVTNDGTVLDADAYDWSEAGIVEMRCGRFSRRRRGVVVTLTHGYDDMPAEVEAVIDRIASRSAADAGVVAQVGQVRYATTASGVGVGGSLTDFDRAVLARYKLPPRP